jgi:Subtilase family
MGTVENHGTGSSPTSGNDIDRGNGRPSWGHDAPFPGRYPKGIGESPHAFGPYLYVQNELVVTAATPESLDAELEELRKTIAWPRLRRRLLWDLLTYRLVGDFPPEEHGIGRERSTPGSLLRSALSATVRMLRLVLFLLGNGFRVPLRFDEMRERRTGRVTVLRFAPIDQAPDLVPVLVQRLRTLTTERGARARVTVAPHHVLWPSAHAIGFSAVPPRPTTATLPSLGALPKDGRPVVIAVVDNGVHDELDWIRDAGPDRVRPLDPADAPVDDLTGALPTYTGHGTFVAGTALDEARQGDRSEDARDVAVLSLKVSGQDGYVSDADAAAGLDRLRAAVEDGRQSPDVVLLAWGGYVHDGTGLPLVTQAVSALLTLPSAPAVVAAAGNDDVHDRLVYPASLPGVVAVAASTGVDVPQPASFANGGPWVDACATGTNVLGPFPVAKDVHVTDVFDGQPSAPEDFNGWAVWSGSSMSAGLVAGAVARRVAASQPPLSGQGAWAAISQGLAPIADIGVSIVARADVTS